MILSTKLHIPHVRSSKVHRINLLQKLNGGMMNKLTLVTAPAGYGKTTALSEWAKQCGRAVVWVSLDAYDNNLVRFWSHVIAAIETAVPGFGRLAPPIMENVLPELFLDSLLTELNHISDELTIVLDDFHLIEQPLINQSMAYFLEFLPSPVHLLVASRFKLSLPLSRLKARGQLHHITTADLRFHLDEGVSFFQDCMDLRLSEDDVSRLIDATEGWISGLQLAALSLRTTANQTEFIREFSGKHRDIAGYLFEEMFQHQSVDMQAFLLETSILTRMNSSLCGAVTGQPDCQDKLELLEKMNMFIVPLDEQFGWYRYHHLFSEFLQQYLKRKNPHKWEPIHAKAAEWSEAHGLEEEAVDYFIAGNLYDEAIRLIEEQLPSLIRLESARLYLWLKAIPGALLSDKPQVTIFYIAVLIATGELAEAESRLREAQDKLGVPDWAPYAGMVYMFCGNMAYIRRDIEQASAYYEKFDQHSQGTNIFQMLSGNSNYAGHTADYDNILAFINDLHAADSFMRRWIQAWENKTGYAYLGYLLVSYSELMYEWDRLEEADHYSAFALERKDMQPYGHILVYAAIQASCVHRVYGTVDKSFELLEQVKSKINSPNRPSFYRRIETHKAYLTLIQGRSDFARKWLKSCGLKVSDEIPLYRIQEYLCLARALGQCGHPLKAVSLLERLYRLVTGEDRLRDTIKVLILQSVTLHRNGETDAALLKLEDALTMAEPHEYIRSFTDEGERMQVLLSHYLRLRQSGFIRESGKVTLLYVKKLLQLLYVHEKGTEQRSYLLTEQELNILRMIEKGMSNQEIANHSYILLSTVKKHIQNMYRKLEVNKRFQALQRAKELRIL